jgi:hypothetical protein
MSVAMEFVFDVLLISACAISLSVSSQRTALLSALPFKFDNTMSMQFNENPLLRANVGHLELVNPGIRLLLNTLHFACPVDSSVEPVVRFSVSAFVRGRKIRRNRDAAEIMYAWFASS